MGRPRKPTAEHAADGTLRQDEHGDRLREPRPGGEPTAPDWLDEEALAHWQEVVPDLIATGVAKGCDTHALAVMCTAWSTWRSLQELQPLNRAKMVYPASRALADWVKIASRFGLTPSDRSRITTDEAPESLDATLKLIA